MKLLVIDGLHAEALTLLKSSGLFETIDEKTAVSGGDFVSLAPGYDAVILRIATHVTAKALEAGAGKLKFVGCASVGFDHVDLQAAQKYNVHIASAAGANAGSVADLALAFLLNFARKLPECRDNLAQAKWDRKSLDGFALSEKVLGILGMGSIGQAFSKRASACDMKVFGYDPLYAPGTKIPGVENMLSSKAELLKICDVLSVHVPREPSTMNIIDVNELKELKPGSYLINTARGGLVNEAAVRTALDHGTLAGYAADVFEQEPLPKDHWIRTHAKVVAAPHMAGSTTEARRAVSEKIVNLLLEFFKAG